MTLQRQDTPIPQMTDPSNNGRSSENSEMRRCQKLHDRFRESQSNRCRETQSNRCSLPDASTLTLDSRLHVYPGMSIPIGLDESELPSDLPDSTDVQPFSNGRRPSKAPASFPAGPYLLSTIVHGIDHLTRKTANGQQERFEILTSTDNLKNTEYFPSRRRGIHLCYMEYGKPIWNCSLMLALLGLCLLMMMLGVFIGMSTYSAYIDQRERGITDSDARQEIITGNISTSSGLLEQKFNTETTLSDVLVSKREDTTVNPTIMITNNEDIGSSTMGRYGFMDKMYRTPKIISDTIVITTDESRHEDQQDTSADVTTQKAPNSMSSDHIISGRHSGRLPFDSMALHHVTTGVSDGVMETTAETSKSLHCAVSDDVIDAIRHRNQCGQWIAYFQFALTSPSRLDCRYFREMKNCIKNKFKQIYPPSCLGKMTLDILIRDSLQKDVHALFTVFKHAGCFDNNNEQYDNDDENGGDNTGISNESSQLKNILLFDDFVKKDDDVDNTEAIVVSTVQGEELKSGTTSSIIDVVTSMEHRHSSTRRPYLSGGLIGSRSSRRNFRDNGEPRGDMYG